jgi:membrane protein implicated in regulation of membrane protease activity
MGWALMAANVLQVLFIAAGVVLPAMYVLGVIFAALWITGIWLARRWEVPVAATPDLSAVSGAVTPQTADKAGSGRDARPIRPGRLTPASAR